MNSHPLKGTSLPYLVSGRIKAENNYSGPRLAIIHE